LSELKSPAQVIVRGFKREKIITIPKSVRLECIQENFLVDDFELSDDNGILLNPNN
jgi:diketogulonate reductase-like aldo/keto reductase